MVKYAKFTSSCLVAGEHVEKGFVTPMDKETFDTLKSAGRVVELDEKAFQAERAAWEEAQAKAREAALAAAKPAPAPSAE